MTAGTPANVYSYRKRVYEKIRPYFAGETALDAGCGDGEDAFMLLDSFKKIEAFDMEENERWKEFSGNINFKTGNAENMDYPDASFDTVIEKDMLHHAGNPEKALSEMARTAKKRIIVLEANRSNPVFYLHLTLMGNHQHFTQKRFRQILESLSLPYEMKHFSARVCVINSKPVITLHNKFHGLLEKLPPYRPIIEYNMGIITKA